MMLGSDKMIRLKEVFKKTKQAFNMMTKRNYLLFYDVVMGLVSSLVIVIVETASFFLVSRDTVKTPYVFLIFAVIMAFQFVGFYAIYHKKFQVKSKLLLAVIEIHPYLIISLGVAMTYVYQGYSNQMYSFLVVIFATTMIQIFSLRKRIFIYVFAFLSFNGMMYLANGVNTIFFEGIRLSIIASIAGFIYSTVQYRTNTGRKHLLDLLEEKNLTQEEALEKLKKAYYDLDQNHRVTEMMLTITSSMLETDFFDDVLQMVLEEAIKVIPKAESGSILIYNGEDMEYKAACGYVLKDLQKVRLKLEDLFQATLDDMYEPAIIVDLQRFDETHLNIETVSLLKNQAALIAQSVLTCSFQYEGNFFGSINLDNFESKEAFDESDKLLIKQLARQIEIIVKIHKLYGEAISQTRYDALTKACSRSYFQDLMQKALDTAKEHQKSLSICYLDINDFKQMNDKWGHETGDRYLLYFADGIRDNAGKNFFLSRLGGDEFALVYPSLDSLEASERISKIRNYLNTHPFKHQLVENILAFGCGIVSYPEDGDSIDELMNIADTRMYENKAQVKKQSA